MDITPKVITDKIVDETLDLVRTMDSAVMTDDYKKDVMRSHLKDIYLEIKRNLNEAVE